MRARLMWLACATAVLLLLAACGGDAGDGTTTDDATSTGTPAGQTAAPEGFEAIPTDGAGESAALAAVPAALEAGKEMRTGAGLDWPDLAGIEPRLIAYLIRVDYDGQVALFEVRADGIAHNLYAYQQAFDSGSIVWTSADMAAGAKAEPQSDREKDAVAAVEAAMEDAFPNEAVAVSVHGYRFVYLDGDTSVLALEVAPDGSIISVGN